MTCTIQVASDKSILPNMQRTAVRHKLIPLLKNYNNCYRLNKNNPQLFIVINAI